MYSALDEIVSRAKCIIEDGTHNVCEVIREAYDDEYGSSRQDAFLWELLKACYCPSDLISCDMEEEMLDYITSEVGYEIEQMVEEDALRREDEEEAENAYYDLGLDEEPQVGNRERDVFENLARVECRLDNGHELYRFFHKDGEHSCTWDDTYRKFVG